MKTRLIAVLMIALVLGGGGALVEFTRQRQRSILSGVFESQPTNVASRTEGRVRTLVEEGAKVKAGDVLAELEAGPGESDAGALAETARQAQAHYLEVKRGPREEDIRRQQAVVAQMQADVDRTRNGPRPEEIESARARYQQSAALYLKASRSSGAEDARLAAAESQAHARYLEAVHGPTREERSETTQRLSQAQARTRLARQELDRQRQLFAQDATSRDAVDRAQADFDTASAAEREAGEVRLQSHLGTRSEEIEQALAGWNQARAALAESRVAQPQDTAAARGEMDAAKEQLVLLEEGNRQEDIRSAEAKLAAAQADLDALRHGSRKEDVAQARATADAAALQARSAQERVRERTVRSPRDGLVERVLVSKGDLLAVGAPVVRLADPTDIWLRVYLPEAGLARVKAGDAAELRVDGISDAVAGVVTTIATQGEFTPANLQTPADRGKQVFAIRIQLAHPDDRVKAGMSATVKRVGDWP